MHFSTYLQEYKSTFTVHVAIPHSLLRRGIFVNSVAYRFVWLAGASVLFYGLRAVAVKASGGLLDVLGLLVVQSALSLPLLFLLLKWQRTSLCVPKPHWLKYGMRVLAGASTTALVFVAIAAMPVALANAFVYSSPLFLVLLGPLLLQEKTSRAMVGLVALGFAGVAVNASPYLHELSVMTVAVGLFAGLSGALLQVSLRKLAQAGEPAARGVFWMHAGILVLLAPVAAAARLWETLSLLHLVAGFVVAVLAVGAQVLNAAAYRGGRALVVNAIALLNIPATALLALVLLDESVPALAWVGMCLTLPACYLLVDLERLAYRNALRKRLLPPFCSRGYSPDDVA